MAEDLDPLASAAALLHRPGLVVLTGPPGSGRTTGLRRLTAEVPGPAHTGGGLAMLRSTPALALSRAVRARLPAHDVHLLAEAVRSRVRGGLLVLDDIQYADPATLAALPLLAGHCRVLVALRTPHRLPGPVADALRAAAAAWLTVPPLDRAAALDLARRTAGGLSEEALSAVADRAGGNPSRSPRWPGRPRRAAPPGPRAWTRWRTPLPPPWPTCPARPAPPWPRSGCSAGPRRARCSGPVPPTCTRPG
ncbi:ATP-binding protein [Paractinoplanes durhamensis]|uniref:ATP-binding protein n=1 Tax=Paractinoplanes durhamensis TaxID=113563 RepID=UPI0036363A9A